MPLALKIKNRVSDKLTIAAGIWESESMVALVNLWVPNLDGKEIENYSLPPHA
jgi:hypothetical protein